MREFIARENIRRFETQLAGCTDPNRRETLSRLLKNERQSLASAIAEKKAMAEASAPRRTA